MSSNAVEPVNNFETNGRRSREVAETRTSRGAEATPRRRVMDIEDAIEWAVRDELPKRGASGGYLSGIGYPSCSPMFRMVDLGVPIDECNFSREPGLPAALGEPHPDALRIEAAIERLERLAAEPMVVGLDLGPDFAADPEDEQAAMAHALRSAGALVVRSAKLRRRPFWETRPTVEKICQSNGKPVTLRWEAQTRPSLRGDVTQDMLMQVTATGGNHYPEGSYCPLRFTPDPKVILAGRAEYLAWWAALNSLAEDLFGELDSIAVLAPSAAQKPWLGDQEAGKPPRIFDDLTARVYQRENRETAAAHRALGMRRLGPVRRGAALIPLARRPVAIPSLGKAAR